MRRHSAYAVAKHGTMAAVGDRGGGLPAAQRAALVAAALRALGTGD